VTLTLTFRSLSIPDSQFSKHGSVRPSYGGKCDRGLSYSGIDEIAVSHLTETEKCRKSILLDKAILQIFQPLKWNFCFSCDGVPLKFKKKNGQASSLPAQIIRAYY
jgi:hypothetical protein